MASISAPSCSSFLAIERSIELKAAGRLSVMVAIGPSIRSSAGSSGWESGCQVSAWKRLPVSRRCRRAFKSQKGRGDNPREVCKMPVHFALMVRQRSCAGSNHEVTMHLFGRGAASNDDENQARTRGMCPAGSDMASDQATLSRPVSTVDPFSHAFLRDPYPHHEALREAGPVVWLEQYGIWTMARHQEVRDALTDWQTYCSSAGVGLSDFRKEPPWRPPSIILEADPPLHTRTRAVLTRILSPAAIKVLRETFEREAESLIERLVERARIRRHCRSRRGLSAQSVSGCGRAFRGWPRKSAALWQHGVQFVRAAQRSVREGDAPMPDRCATGSCRSAAARRWRPANWACRFLTPSMPAS